MNEKSKQKKEKVKFNYLKIFYDFKYLEVC